MNDDSPSDGIKLGDIVDGQTLVAVGIDFTFTEIIESHQALNRHFRLNIS